MHLPEKCQLLRVFVRESDKYEHIPVYEWIVKKAHEQHMAGATVIRGTEGFCADGRGASSKILSLSLDLPILIELVDTAEKIEQFSPLIDPAIEEGLATVEPVQVVIAKLKTPSP